MVISTTVGPVTRTFTEEVRPGSSFAVAVIVALPAETAVYSPVVAFIVRTEVVEDFQTTFGVIVSPVLSVPVTAAVPDAPTPREALSAGEVILTDAVQRMSSAR